MQGGEITGEAKTRRQKNPNSIIVLISGFGMHFSRFMFFRGKKMELYYHFLRPNNKVNIWYYWHLRGDSLDFLYKFIGK